MLPATRKIKLTPASNTQPAIELNREPIWGPIGKEVFERTYARVKPNGNRETWEETVTRVVEGNLRFVDEKFVEKNEQQELFNLLYNFNVLPAGRHLWVTGIPGRAFIANCWNSHWYSSFSRHFTFLFERLMEGGGVGSNYSNKYLKQYPAFKNKVELHFVCSPSHRDYDSLKSLLSEEYSHEWTGATTVLDSREGWVSTLKAVVDAAYSDTEKPVIVFDMSQVRPQGTRIKTFGGTASGPGPLIEMLKHINEKLNKFAGKKPTSMLCMEIDHEIGQCVVAGNVRRSARMSMKYWKDEDIFDFLTCKADGTAHWTTNISVVLDNQFFRKLNEKDKHAKEIAKFWANGQLKNGEPGFYNISKASEGEPSEAFTTNPCVLGTSWVMTNEGPRRVKDLVSKEDLVLQVDGKLLETTDKGFFSSGKKKLCLLTTEEGYSLVATSDHPVFISKKDSFEKVNLSNVRPGTLIRLSNHNFNSWQGSGTFEQGWLLGLLIGDGCISNGKAYIDAWGEEKDLAYKAADILKTTTITRSHFGPQEIEEADKVRVSCKSLMELANQFNLTSTKVISDNIQQASSIFYRGFLRGFFDTDGSVQGTAKKGYSIRLFQSNGQRLSIVQDMLLRLGIYSRIYNNRRCSEYRELPDGNGGKKLYHCEAQHELVITADQLIKFNEIIGFECKHKKERLNNIISNYSKGPYLTKFVAEVKSVTELPEAEVFDVQVPNENAFDCDGFYVGNCGEICFSSASENCNLGHVNMASFVNDQSGFLKACRLMARFLIRATYADFPDEEARRTINTNRRIGVGLFGFQSWLNLQGIKFSESYENIHVRRFLSKAREVIRKEARDYAFQLRIPEPIKVTCVAPTGTIAKLPGETEGIHPVFGRYFIRRISYSELDPGQKSTLDVLRASGYKIEDSVYTPNTKVVSFHVKDPLVDRVVAAGYSETIVEQAGEISLEDMLLVQAMVQEEYADNAISFTINIKTGDYEVADLILALKAYGPRLKGSTIMPMESNRPQTPYEQITKEEYEAATQKTVGQAELDCINGCPIR